MKTDKTSDNGVHPGHENRQSLTRADSFRVMTYLEAWRDTMVNEKWTIDRVAAELEPKMGFKVSWKNIVTRLKDLGISLPSQERAKERVKGIVGMYKMAGELVVKVDAHDKLFSELADKVNDIKDKLAGIIATTANGFAGESDKIKKIDNDVSDLARMVIGMEDRIRAVVDEKVKAITVAHMNLVAAHNDLARATGKPNHTFGATAKMT